MTPKQLEKIVLDKIYEGKSYQQMYDELNAQFPNREIDLARMVAGNATMDQRTKHGLWNILMMVVIIVNICFNVFVAILMRDETGTVAVVMTLIFTGVYVYLLLRVIKWDLRVYKFVGGLGLLGLVRISMATIGGAVGGTLHFELLNPLNIIPMSMVALGFYLHARLGGKYKTASQQYKDAKGLIRARHTIQFQN